MANSLGNTQNISFERNKVIIVTKRTVRFANTVYQTRNITGFSECNIDTREIPEILIALALILSLLAYAFFEDIGDIMVVIGSLLMWFVILGALWNKFRPKRYGLLLTLNSGDKKLFTKTDKLGLKRVISVISDFIETERDTTYQISIENSKVQGNFIHGDVRGDVSSYSGG